MADAHEKARSSTPIGGVLDIGSDPNVHRHESGSYECKLCLTVHANANSYLIHAQGKRHERNAALRSAGAPAPARAAPPPRQFAKIGLPQYNIIKVRDPQTLVVGVRFELAYPRIRAGTQPQFRFMSSYEQQVEDVDTAHQYLVVAAEPYETVALRIPARRVDDASLWSHFDSATGAYALQFLFAA